MKLLNNEQQAELRSLIESVITDGSASHMADLTYWAIELKPKRTRRKILETHESVIEDAYKEHTGQI